MINVAKLINRTIIGTVTVDDELEARNDVTLTLDDGTEFTIHDGELEISAATKCPTCGRPL